MEVTAMFTTEGSKWAESASMALSSEVRAATLWLFNGGADEDASIAA